MTTRWAFRPEFRRCECDGEDPFCATCEGSGEVIVEHEDNPPDPDREWDGRHDPFVEPCGPPQGDD